MESSADRRGADCYPRQLLTQATEDCVQSPIQTQGFSDILSLLFCQIKALNSWRFYYSNYVISWWIVRMTWQVLDTWIEYFHTWHVDACSTLLKCHLWSRIWLINTIQFSCFEEVNIEISNSILWKELKVNDFFFNCSQRVCVSNVSYKVKWFLLYQRKCTPTGSCTKNLPLRSVSQFVNELQNFLCLLFYLCWLHKVTGGQNSFN